MITCYAMNYGYTGLGDVSLLPFTYMW